jgi:HK97 family phage major capsid protein
VFDEARAKALTTGTDSAGGYIVPVQAVAQLIELIRAESIVMQLGVTPMPGLVGSPVEIPKVTGGATGYWVAENAGITASDQTVGQIQMAPRMAAAMTKLSNRLIALSNPAAEQIVRQDLALVLALLVDLAVMKGTGASGQPLGMSEVSGIGTSSLATIGTGTAGKLVDFVGQLETANALRGKLGWAFHPTGGQLLRKQADSEGRPLFQSSFESAGASVDPNKLLIGYPARTSTQLATTDAFFANWADVILGEWGSLQLDASQETSDAFEKNQTWVRIIREVDVGVRHAESICYVSDLAA